MKRVIYTILFLIACFNTWAQTPEAINYQAALRGVSGNVLANEAVKLKLSIRQGNATGQEIYSEEHAATTTAQGLVNLQIGKGTNTVGVFNAINWGNNQHFLKVEIEQGGTFVTLGTTQLVSVPYSFYADKSDSATYAIRTLLADSAASARWSRSSDTAIIATSMKLNDLLDVNSTAPMNGQVLQWQGSTWAPANSGASWNLLGNSGTSPSNSFLGTNDSSDLVIGTDSMQRIRLFGNGNILLGDSINGMGSKMIWYPKKSAFRVGLLDCTSYNNCDPNNFWVNDSVGIASFAAGRNTKAKGYGAVALGVFSEAMGTGAVAMGNGAKAMENIATAFGNGKALAASSFAVGNGIAEGFNSTAIGVGRTTGEYSFAGGNNNTIAKGTASFAFGTLCNANGDYSVALGSSSIADGTTSISMGIENNATGYGAIAIGASSTAMGDNSVSIGNYSTTNGFLSFALGRDVTANGESSFAIGRNATAAADYSTTLNYGGVADGVASTTVGYENISSGYASLSTGIYNDPIVAAETAFNAASPAFLVGNGNSSSARSNAFAVFYNGNATLSGLLTQSSDRRLKRNINPIGNALSDIQLLKGVTYNWNGLNNHDTTQLQYGVIAQEIEQILPELVTTDANGYKSVNYIGIVPVLIEAVKELKGQLADKDVTMNELKADNASIHQKLELLMEQLKGASLLTNK